MASEAQIQQEIRLALGRRSVLFRNNSGAYQCPKTGRWIHYGVGSPGGADLIGWHTLTITPDMVGKRVAVFTAIECKSATGKPTEAQQNFIDQVNKAGGISGICRSAKEAEALFQAGLPLVL